MKIFLIVLSCLWLSSTPVWETDIERAKQEALDKHHLILLNFSGSDWCGPCIRLKQEIFESTVFQNFADQELVLLNADFPRSKKHQLSKEQQKLNDSLADKYNPEGHFPYTLLLDANGKVIKTWEGFPNINAESFVDQLKKSRDAAK